MRIILRFLVGGFNFSFIFIVRIFRVDISREYLRQNKKRKPRTRFPFSWCGRQELKTCDDKKKALIFKAFLLLNAKMDAQKIHVKIKNGHTMYEVDGFYLFGAYFKRCCNGEYP